MDLREGARAIGALLPRDGAVGSVTDCFVYFAQGTVHEIFEDFSDD